MTAFKRLLTLLLLAVFAPARADWLSGNLGLASDDLFRGLDQTNGLAVQGGLDYARSSGLYAGAWATNNRSAGGGEFDLYGGYSQPLTLFQVLAAAVDAGVTGYVYSGSRDASLGGGRQDFAELYAGLGAGPAFLKVYYAPDYAGRGAGAWYLQGTLKYPLGAGFTLRGALGYSGGGGVERQTAFLTADHRGHDYLDYSLRLSRSFRYGLSAWLEVAGTDLHLADGAQGGGNQPKFLAGLREDFDF